MAFKDPEKRRRRKQEYMRKWRAANGDKIREQHRRYHAANREKEIEKSRIWRENNRDRFRETKRKWREENPDKVADYNSRRIRIGDMYLGMYKPIKEDEWPD